MKRTLSRIERPVPEPGFAGDGHTSLPLVRPDQFERNDPFIRLVDDRVQGTGDRPGGAPHPHAGIEIVTLMLEGQRRTRHPDGEGFLEAGDVEWLTAGRGVIESGMSARTADHRILQLWLTLPRKDRWASPESQVIRGASVPIRREPGAELKLYSGSSGGLKSPTRNHVPATLADIRLYPNGTITQDLENSENGLLYGLEGSLRIEDQILGSGEVGWLGRPKGKGTRAVRMTAGEGGARVILLAGRVQQEPIVHCGPFVADSNEDIIRAYQNYRAGQMGPIAPLRC